MTLPLLKLAWIMSAVRPSRSKMPVLMPHSSSSRALSRVILRRCSAVSPRSFCASMRASKASSRRAERRCPVSGSVQMYSRIARFLRFATARWMSVFPAESRCSGFALSVPMRYLKTSTCPFLAAMCCALRPSESWYSSTLCRSASCTCVTTSWISARSSFFTAFISAFPLARMMPSMSAAWKSSRSRTRLRLRLIMSSLGRLMFTCPPKTLRMNWALAPFSEMGRPPPLDLLAGTGLTGGGKRRKPPF
mmetsp:Transcript_6676/g.19062  ORF Transcript_6676/g.19062 Transcript_6676/m.19062 type:complete len:249 (-) Transcript_6676:912-1658(-)